MLSQADFYQYQHRAVKHCIEHLRAMLWLDMSLGKTAIILTAIDHHLTNLNAYRFLVLGPRRVVETVWQPEIAKWSHVKHLKAVLLRGSTAQKVRDLHRADVDIHLINYESIPWLVRQVNQDFLARGRFPPWNAIVFDEVDMLKSAQGKRFQMLEPLLPYFRIRYGMTGTPGDNGYADLHGQYRVVDGGKRLFKEVGDFRRVWCTEAFDGLRTAYRLRPDAKQEIEARVADITLSMTADDYIKLPDYQYHDHFVDLEPKVQKAYETMEAELFAAMDRHEDDPLDGEWELCVSSRLGARAKCRQIANGAVKTEDGSVNLVHDAKLEMLDTIVHEANGRPIFVAYLTRADMARIVDRYGKQGYRVAYIGPGVKGDDAMKIVNQWNAGNIDILTSYPSSSGHGLNLQFGGNEIVWFGLTDNLRFYRQLNARLRRIGQTSPNVHIRRILARNTIDEALSDLLNQKTADASALRSAVERYRRAKGC